MTSCRTTALAVLIALAVLATPAWAAKSGAEQMREFEYNQMKAAVANYQLPLQPPPGKALVFVVRPSGGANIVRFNVYVDSKDDASEIGYTRSGQYIYFSLPPGSHRIYSKAENWAELQLSVNAGDVIFLKQEPNIGLFMAGNSLYQVDDIEGKYQVKRLAKGEMLKVDDAVSAGAGQTAQPVAPIAQPAAPQNTQAVTVQQPTNPQQQVSTEPLAPPVGSTSEIAQKLRELQTLWKEGLLTDDEYKSKKRQLLEKF